MMMNCMNTGTGALTIAGIRLADAALALTALLLVLLAAVAAVAVVRFFFDLARRSAIVSPGRRRLHREAAAGSASLQAQGGPWVFNHVGRATGNQSSILYGNQTAKAHEGPGRSSRCCTRSRGEYCHRLRRPRTGFVRESFDAAGRGQDGD